MTHPCTGNFSWVGKNALENYTMAIMEHELDEANTETLRLLGVKPRTFPIHAVRNSSVGAQGHRAMCLLLLGSFGQAVAFGMKRRTTPPSAT